MFSDIDNKYLNNINIDSEYNNVISSFFLPINSQDVSSYSSGKQLQTAAQQVAPASVAIEVLPPGWEQLVINDTSREDNGKVYYFNKSSNVAQWEKPINGGGSRSSRSTKKTSIKKRILKKPKKTIRNTK